MSADDHYLFYLTAHSLKGIIHEVFAEFPEGTQDFNFDTIVIDYLIFETEDKDSFKIGGVAALIQEPYRTKAYTNAIFNQNDLKNSGERRHITGIRPLDHLEVMIIKEHCDKIDILDTYNQVVIDEWTAVYKDGFATYFGVTDEGTP